EYGADDGSGAGDGASTGVAGVLLRRYGGGDLVGIGVSGLLFGVGAAPGRAGLFAGGGDGPGVELFVRRRVGGCVRLCVGRHRVLGGGSVVVVLTFRVHNTIRYEPKNNMRLKQNTSGRLWHALHSFGVQRSRRSRSGRWALWCSLGEFE